MQEIEEKKEYLKKQEIQTNMKSDKKLENVENLKKQEVEKSVKSEKVRKLKKQEVGKLQTFG